MSDAILSCPHHVRRTSSITSYTLARIACVPACPFARASLVAPYYTAHALEGEHGFRCLGEGRMMISATRGPASKVLESGGR